MSRVAFAYLWVSPSSSNPEALVAQARQNIEAFCREKKITLRQFYIDLGVGGVATKRPQAVQMFHDLDEDETIDLVIVDSLNNLGRRLHDSVVFLHEFADRKAGCVSIREDIDTSTNEGASFLQSLFRIPQLAQWVKPKNEETTRIRAKEVLYNGGACPYGYRIDEKSNQYRVVEDEANVIRRIFRERLSGRSLRQIAGDLTKEGIATKRGGRWQANTIKTILENIFYTGAYLCHGKLYKDDHDLIISEHLFRQVNEMNQAVLMYR